MGLLVRTARHAALTERCVPVGDVLGVGGHDKRADVTDVRGVGVEEGDDALDPARHREERARLVVAELADEVEGRGGRGGGQTLQKYRASGRGARAAPGQGKDTVRAEFDSGIRSQRLVLCPGGESFVQGFVVRV